MLVVVICPIEAKNINNDYERGQYSFDYKIIEIK